MGEKKMELENNLEKQEIDEIHTDLLDNEFAQLVQDLIEKRNI